MSEKFTPSPGKLVRFVDDQGKIVSERRLNRKERRLNRKERRRLGIRGKKEKTA